MAAGRANSDCVKVALRVRPLIGIEVAKGDNEFVISYPSGLHEPQLQIGGDSGKCYTFDNVFTEKSNQTQVYEQSVQPLVHSFLEGYNATVIAYGQTGSGKTYTMGTSGCDDAKLQEEWGVIPTAINDIFNTLNNQKGTDDDDYKVQCSFIEIYNEEIKDLLDPDSSKVLNIRENPDGPSKIYIPNLKLEVMENTMDMLEALDRGGASRATAYTQMNAQSSRSHAIFTIHLHHIKAQPNVNGEDSKNSEPVVIQSKFHFVDLAGSERAKKTGASGARFQEGISINAGLLALGNVIAALGDPRLKSKHVPFRDSKITRLLQDSLGGNSRTLMIACVSPARSNMLETKNTLNYANRAKNIKNKAVVNRDPRSRQILELRQRVKELERQLKGGGIQDIDHQHHHQTVINERELEQHLEQISQLQSDLNDSNNEVLKLQEKLKHLRLNLSELQDKYYNEVGAANTNLKLEQKKRMDLIEKIREKYSDFEQHIEMDQYMTQEEEEQIKGQLMGMEIMRMENETLKRQNEQLQKTIIKNESRDQNFVHNLHHQMAKLVRGDFSNVNSNLISPTKRIDVASSTESIPELSVYSEDASPTNTGCDLEANDKNVILLEHTDDEDEDDDDEDEYEEDNETGFDDDDDDEEEEEEEEDDDHDVNMMDSGRESMKRENKQKVKLANTEREALKKEKKLSLVYKKKLLKEQKQHNKQMEFIANEQLSRERSQRLKSEKYNREIDKTNRDITQLQTMLKQLCQQRQSDMSKQAFYEKQVQTLSKELEEAHRQGKLYEVEKAKLNPNDIKKLQAQEMKISNYQNKVKSLTLQIKSYKDKLGQIRKLQSMHKEDMLKMSQMTRKLGDLKKKKVDLQRKLKDENKTYAKWKQQSEKTIKQLRKIQREKNIQLQRHKSQLNKTETALKQKTAALVHLKKKQREMELRKNNTFRRNNISRNIRRGRNGGNVKQIKSKIAKLLSSLIIRHQLFHKYKSFDREYKSLQHELKHSENGLNEVNIVLNQFDEHTQDEDEEFNRLKTEKLEYEQRIEDTQSTIKYIREQMIAMSYKMKENDHKRWKQLQKEQKVSLTCTESDLDKFLTVTNTPYARSCINFLINQHLKFRLIIDDYKKTTKHLKSERDKILANADNELRKKNVLIEKLQNSIQVERQKHRFEQIKTATDTIDNDATQTEDDDITSMSFHHQQSQDMDNTTDIDNDSDQENKDMMVLDDTDNDCDDDLNYHQDQNMENNKLSTPIPIETDLENDLKRKQDELNESKKLLNMYRSPQHRARVDSQQPPNTMTTPFQFNNDNNTNNNNKSLRFDSFRNKTVTPLPIKTENILPGHDDRTSVQLTPFHTPIVKSKTRSFTSNPSTTYNSFLSNNNNNNNNQPQSNNNHQNNNNNNYINSQRSTSTSPLFGSRIINEPSSSLPVQQSNNNNNHPLHLDLAPITEQHQPPRVGNVFSRLTNPKHFIGTARNRVQELQALKEKVRKQKESHSQLQRRSNWQKRKTMQSPPQNNNEDYVDHHHIPYNQQQQSHLFENENNKSTVFERLHATSIRNKRTGHNLNNSLNGDLNGSFNESATFNEQQPPINTLQDSMLFNEPSRVLNQNEMSKKPQRNSNNDANEKSMLMNPVRVLTPDA